MGLFNKRPRQQPGTTATTTGTNGTKGGFFGRRSGNKAAKKDRVSQQYSMAKRPSFGQWLKYTWLDIATMAAMGIIGLGVSTSSRQPERSNM